MNITTYPDILYAKDIDGGAPSSIYAAYGLAGTVNYQELIGLGKLSGHSSFRGMGRRVSISTATPGDDIWEGAATSLVYPNQSTGEQCTLVSTSANDTLAGSGSQKVNVHYLTNAGAEAIETVNMNGLTPVNTTATNIRFVQYIVTQQVASLGNTAAGDITIYSTATPANIFNIIKAGGNMSLGSHRMIPAGKTFYMNYINTSAVDNKPISVRFRATCDFNGALTSNIFIYNEIFELQNASIFMNLDSPRSFPALCIIKGTAYAASVGGNVALSYGGWIK